MFFITKNCACISDSGKAEYRNKGRWKRVADKVNRAYHYNIKRTTSYGEKGVEPPKPREPKYIVRCPACGHQWKHYRKCFAVNYPTHCTCSTCGVKLERIK